MHLTHCGRDKMTPIWHTTILYSFSWLQNNVCININRNEILIQRVQITIRSQHLLTEVYVGSHELNSKRLLVVSIAGVFHWTIFQDCQILHCLYTKQFSLTQKLLLIKYRFQTLIGTNITLSPITTYLPNTATCFLAMNVSHRIRMRASHQHLTSFQWCRYMYLALNVHLTQYCYVNYIK